MTMKEMRNKSVDDLTKELLERRREHFNLRMQRGSGQLVKPHQMGETRRDIARLKMVLGEKGIKV